MNPINDIVCILLETPFNQWRDEDKRAILCSERPTGLPLISARKEIKKSGKSYNINCKKNWFTEFKWLCSSTVLQRFFCWPCLLFSNKYSSWNKDGFADLLNITRSLHKHADSAEHLKCELKLRNFEKSQNTVADVLRENAKLFKLKFNENVRLNRQIMEIVIDAVLYLSKQELSFHGHDECNDSTSGNFKELLALLISRSSLNIKNHYNKIKNIFSVDSKTTQNEVIHCVSDCINDHVKDEINGVSFFSIQINDTTDIIQTSQCSLILRFVDSQGVLVERFLGFHDISKDKTSETLYNLLDTILEQFDYEHKLVGQCYDGASVMSGHLNELQKKIKNKASQAVFVHCLALPFNFVLQQSISKISKCRIFFASLSEISSFFHQLGRRSCAFTLISTQSVPIIIEARWSSISKLISVIVEDWDKLKEVFEVLTNSEQSDKKTIQLAKSFLNDMNNFEFTFLAVLFNDIFCTTDVLFEILQKESLDINYCISQIKNIHAILSLKKSDDAFEKIIGKASKISKIDNIKREYNTHTSEGISQNYRQLYLEILDLILMELDTRFEDCEKIRFVCLANTMKFKQLNLHFPFEALVNLQQFYGNMFNKDQRLKNELVLIYADEKFRNVTMQELLSILHNDRDIFREAYKLFSLILTIPSTSVSVERNFSCFQRIKTYARNTISQEGLSSLANISIQKDLLMELLKMQPFYDDIIDKFAALY